MTISAIQIYVKDINLAFQNKSIAVEDQFRKLYALEARFSKKLKTVAGGKQVYHDFIHFIRKHPGGILQARPYFREREVSYRLTINIAIEKALPKLMYDSKINFQFCKFAIERLKIIHEERNRRLVELGKAPRPLNLEIFRLFDEIGKVREQIILPHLTLAMSKAKGYQFKSATIEYADLVQMANEGVISAVDKYVMEEDGLEFYKVAIGRMTANLITNGFTGLSVNIGPHAGKKLYTIRKILEKLPNATVEEIAAMVELDSLAVTDLLAATSYLSLDKEIEGTDLRMIDTIASPIDARRDPYLAVESAELSKALQNFSGTLTLIERKLLILKGHKL